MAHNDREPAVDQADGTRNTGNQQHTGNHKQPGAPDAKGADKHGGTRAGAENVEPSVGPDARQPDAAPATD